MCINIEAVNSIAKLIGSVGIIFGVPIALHEFVERDQRQSKLIDSILSEQQLLCYGIKVCLQGIVEQGI